MFLNNRKQLKKICREIAFNNFSYKDITYKRYNMAILCIMAICVLGRLQQKHPNQIKDVSSFSKAYMKEINLLTNRFPFFAERVKYITYVPDAVFLKVINYVNGVENSLDNILAWTYQYLKYDREKEVYASSLKDGKKIEGAEIALATQFFTEDYMVGFLVNKSLEQMDLTKGKLPSIRILDPACGGGNFLVCALEVLYTRFAPQMESNQQLIKELIENVLIGYDVDPDLSEIASLNLFLKASSYVNPEQLEVCPSIYTTSDRLDQIGSLRKVNVKNQQSVINISSGEFYPETNVFESESYDLILTNPPFMGKRNMGSELLGYLKHNYPYSKGDLCIAFFIRCMELIRNKGIVGIVNQTSWMFLKSYCEIRRDVLENNQIIEVVDLGSNSFFDIKGEKTNVALTLLKKDSPRHKVRFTKLKSLSLEQKVEVLVNEAVTSDLVSYRLQDELLKNESYVFQYDSTQTIDRFFKNLTPYKEYATPMQGTSTGDNKQFIDYAWNHQGDPNWVLVSKGGGYSKWSGLNIYKVKWGKDAEFIKEHPSSALRNLKYMSETQLVYSDTGTRGLSVRLLKEGQIFIASGPGIRIHSGLKFAHLAYLNTRTVSYFLKLLSPKFTIAAGYIGRLPITEFIINSKELAGMGEKCYKLKESYLSKRLTNAEFVQPDYSKIHSVGDYISECIKRDLDEELERLKLEFEIENFVQSKMGMTHEDIQRVTETVGQPVYSIKKEKLDLPVHKLDHLASTLLSQSCQYVSNKKKIFGMEGVLEDLSFTLEVNPVFLHRYILNNMSLLHKVREIYYDDLFHKALLSRYGFSGHNYECANFSTSQLISDLTVLLPLVEKEQIEEWITQRFWTMHLKVFSNNPVLNRTESSSGVSYYTLGNLVTN